MCHRPSECQKLERFLILWIEFECSLKTYDRVFPLFQIEVCMAQREVSVQKLRIEFYSALKDLRGLREQACQTILHAFLVKTLGFCPGFGRNISIARSIISIINESG